MKKLILIILTVTSSVFSLSACKKNSPAPASCPTGSVPAQTSATNSTVRIQVTTTLSALDGKFDGDIQVVTDTVVNTILFNRHFAAPFGSSTGSFDTTFIVSSQYLNINTLLYTEKWTGSIYDLDPIADTYMTIWVDGIKKVYLKNTIIAESVNVK